MSVSRLLKMRGRAGCTGAAAWAHSFKPIHLRCAARISLCAREISCYTVPRMKETIAEKTLALKTSRAHTHTFTAS